MENNISNVLIAVSFWKEFKSLPESWFDMFDGKSKAGLDKGVLATAEDSSYIKGEEEFDLKGMLLMGSSFDLNNFVGGEGGTILLSSLSDEEATNLEFGLKEPFNKYLLR